MEKHAPPQYAPPETSPMYPLQPAAQPPVVVNYGPVPVMTNCPSCNSRITSRVEAESSLKTHILAVLLCGLCCCCIPYMMDSCKNKNHYCPHCGAFLGAYNN